MKPSFSSRPMLFLLVAALAVVGLAAFFGPLLHGTLHGVLPGVAWDGHAGLGLAAMGLTKSKFFRIATEGATTDGRNISRDWIAQMAKNFDRAKYGARVWLEHYRGIAPDGLFKAYGDVVALEARTVEDGKLGLFAQIEPLPDLVAMNKAKQKIYTSCEVDPKFAGGSEAYLVGLGVTDSPASLGTEVLQFAQQHQSSSPFAGRKTQPENLFTAAVETQLEFEEAGDDGSAEAAKFSAKFKDILSGMFGKKAAGDSERFAAIQAGLEAMAQAVTDKAAGIDKQAAEAKAAHAKTAADLAALQGQFSDLVARLDKEPAQHTQRPPATGGSGAVLTDC